MGKFKTLSYWVQLLITEGIAQGIWWGVSKMIHAPLFLQSVIAGVIVVAGMLGVLKWGLYRKPLATKSKPSTEGETKAEERELLALHQRQKENWGQYIRLHLTRVVPDVVGDVPKVTFEFEAINYLPVDIVLVKVAHSSGTVSAGKQGACTLPPLPETIDQTIHACGEKRFRIEMGVSGTKLPEFLRPLLPKAGQRLQWMLKGEWYVQVYEKTEVWQYRGHEIMHDQVIERNGGQ
jgi:hypothetical protein